MPEEQTATPPPPPATTTGEGGTKKKKKEKAPPPPTPPAVATAYLVCKTAALGTLGVLSTTALGEECHVSPFQQTFLKDKALTGKFTLTIKKTAATPAMLSDHFDVNAFWTTLNATVTRLVSNETNNATIDIETYEMTRAQIMETYGPGALDEGQVPSNKKSKVKDDDVLTVAVLGNQIVAVTPGQPLATVQSLETCHVDVEQSDWKRLGKKETKVTIKFVATVADETGLATAKTTPPPTKDELVGSVWKFPEGEALRQQVEEKDAAEAAAAQKEEEQAQAVVVAEEADQDMVVTAYDVKGKIDYDKLVQQFGSQLIQPTLMQKLEALTVGQGRVPALHRFLRRNIFFSHRDLDTLLNCVEKGTPMYLYTGRGPSSAAMHLGHLIPFLFTQWLQKALGCPLVIQMTDDEKFLFKGNYDEFEGDNLNHFAQLTMENAKDIIACEFDFDKTFLFSDLDYVGSMYPNIVRIWKAVTTNTVNGIFGFDGSSNIGKIAFPAIQAAPSFANSFPKVLEADRNTDQLCLIPCAIDQDPYFRMTRDVAHKLVHKKHPLGGKPSLIHSKFFPPLQGATGKMSSSDENSAIFLTDTPQQIHDKIMNHAFSGGQMTKEDQQKYGANLEVDVAYQWLRFFLEDDEELEKIGKDYGSGSGEYWSTSSVKKRLITLLQDLVAKHQERRAKITDEEVRKWMQERSILVKPSS